MGRTLNWLFHLLQYSFFFPFFLTYSFQLLLNFTPSTHMIWYSQNCYFCKILDYFCYRFPRIKTFLISDLEPTCIQDTCRNDIPWVSETSVPKKLTNLRVLRGRNDPRRCLFNIFFQNITKLRQVTVLWNPKNPYMYKSCFSYGLNTAIQLWQLGSVIRLENSVPLNWVKVLWRTFSPGPFSVFFTINVLNRGQAGKRGRFQVFLRVITCPACQSDTLPVDLAKRCILPKKPYFDGIKQRAKIAVSRFLDKIALIVQNQSLYHSI